MNNMIHTYELIKSFPWYKKWLLFTYDSKKQEILTDLVNSERLHCELPNDVIIKNKSWFKKIASFKKSNEDDYDWVYAYRDYVANINNK